MSHVEGKESPRLYLVNAHVFKILETIDLKLSCCLSVPVAMTETP